MDSNISVWIPVVSVAIIIVVLVYLRKSATKNRMTNALQYNFVVEDFQKARDYYRDEEEQGNIEATIYLARLYHGGLHDHAPNPKKAIKYYTKAVDQGVYYCLLNIGDIYNYGLANIAQNQRKARKYYTRLAEFCERGNSDLDKYYLNQAKQRIEAVDATFGPGGFFYDAGIGQRELDNNQIELNLDVEQIFARARQLPENRTFRRDFVDTIRFHNRPRPRRNDRRQRDERVPTALDNPIVVHNDAQNVHDRILNQTIENSIQNLQNTTQMDIPKDTAIHEVRQAIMKFATGSKQAQAQMTLNSLGNSNVGANNLSERGLLHLVWNRIQGYRNKEKQKTAVENLINELSEASENGTTVCASGKFNRIIDSLNQLDKDVEIRPTWALNRELMDTAAHLRQKMLEDEPDHVQAAMNSSTLSPEVEKTVDEFNEKFKTHLVQKLERDYVDAGVVSKEELSRQMDAWLNHV